MLVEQGVTTGRTASSENTFTDMLKAQEYRCTREAGSWVMIFLAFVLLFLSGSACEKHQDASERGGDHAPPPVMVSGLEPGHMAKIVAEGGLVVASGSEEGGTARIVVPQLAPGDTLATNPARYDLIITDEHHQRVGALEAPVHPGKTYEWEDEAGDEGGTVLHVPARDGAWSWFAEPRALQHQGVTYYGANTTEGDAVIRAYDHRTEEVESFTLRSFSQNDHSNVLVKVRDDGRLQAYYSEHNGDRIYVRTSTAPGSISSWRDETALEEGGDFTYPTPVGLTDRVVLHWRQGRGGAGTNPISYRENDRADGEGRWGSVVRSFRSQR